MSVSFPIYMIQNKGKWIVVTSPGRRDIKHTTLWETLVSKMVAKECGLKYSDIKNLPYCQMRARIVQSLTGKGKLYFGDHFTKEQKSVIKHAFGDLDFIYDEHEKMSEYDLDIFNEFKLKRTA